MMALALPLFLQGLFLTVMNVPEDIKRRIDERYARCPFSSIVVFLRENPDVDGFLQEMVDKEPWFKTKRKAFSCIARNIFEPVKCANCGTVISIEKAIDGKKYCSNKCSCSSPERIEKVRQTSIAKFGCANVMQSKSIQDRLRKTNLERYGVENVFQTEEAQEKTRKTNLERYGSELYVKSQDWKEKTVATNLEKFGVEFPSQNPDVMEKVKQTNLEKYGGVAPACSQEVVDKMRHTNIERYGNECSLNNADVAEKREETWNEKYGGHPLSNPTVIRQRKNTNIEKYGAELYTSSPVYFAQQYDKFVKRFDGKVEPLFSASEYHGINCGEKYKWHCCKCGSEFETHVHITDFDKDERLLPRCPNCYPLQAGVSSGEIDLLEYVKSIYDGEIIDKDRSVIHPLELDIYIPDKKVAIEFDGLYWHSEEQGKGEDYHLAKTNKCNENGIRLIHVFEDEWRKQQDIVKDRIKSILGIGQHMIFARKCTVGEIDAKMSNEFLDVNHIQGADNASIRYGLFYNDELVATMTFGKPRFSKSYDWELIRYASKLGTHVVGGASKLLNHFRKSHSGSIVSYADRRYSDGNLYEKLGFRLHNVSYPNYWYVKGAQKLNRYACQKHKLSALLGDSFNPEMSEYENMTQNGWNRIYDCGNFVFVKE